MVDILDITIYLIYLVISLIFLITFNLSLRFIKYYINKKATILYKKTFTENITHLNKYNKINNYKKTDNNDIIRVIFYNAVDDLIINMKELEFIEEEKEWFLSLLIKYGKDDKSNIDANGYIIYKTDEDYTVFKSLIKTIQYNKIILYDDVNINVLYEIAEKMCIPEKILEKIKKTRNIENEMKHLNKLFTKKELLYLRQTFKCKLCKQGFTHFNNKQSACKYHTMSFNINGSFYSCCGKRIDDEPCKISKHVPEIAHYELELIKTILTNID